LEKVNSKNLEKGLEKTVENSKKYKKNNSELSKK